MRLKKLPQLSTLKLEVMHASKNVLRVIECKFIFYKVGPLERPHFSLSSLVYPNDVPFYRLLLVTLRKEKSLFHVGLPGGLSPYMAASETV